MVIKYAVPSWSIFKVKKSTFTGLFALTVLVLVFAPTQRNKFPANVPTDHNIICSLHPSGFISNVQKTNFCRGQNDNLKPSEKRHKKSRIPEILIPLALTNSRQVHFISLHFFELNEPASTFSGSIGYLHRGPPNFNV